METEQIIRLIETVSKSGLTEFKYQEGDVRLVLKSAPPVCTQVPAAAPVMVSAEAANVAVQTNITAEQESTYNDDDIIKSPLVGTFYSASSEDAEPFVTEGDTVKKGQVIGIIETMKLMNEVESDRDGVVTAILIENEQVVEFGQPLFAIR